MTSSRVDQEALPLSTLKTVRTPRRPRSVLTEWSLMGAGSEWISLLQNEPILPLLESTWDVPHTVVAVVVEAVVEAEAVVAVVHRGVPRGTTTGATTEAMTEVMTVIMIAMMTENTDHTDADLRLLTIAGGTAHDPGHGPTRHVTTEQRENSQ